MKNLVIFLTLFTLAGIALAQQKSTAPAKETTLKAGDSVEIAVDVTPEEMLPKNCKDWNVAELPDNPGSLFVCKDGKWTEYVRKDKACSESKTDETDAKPVKTTDKAK